MRTPLSGSHVSVVLCTRDRAERLAQALGALAVALPVDAEVIVIDSGSRTPATADVARAAGVRYVRSDIPGLSIARNLGLATSGREIVIFTDDDCLVDPHFFPGLIAPFESADVGATTGLLRDSSDTGFREPSPSVTLTTFTEGLDAGHGALMAFRRASLVEQGGFDPILGAGRHFGGAEDMDAICRVLFAGQQTVHVPGAVVRHVYTRDDDDYTRLNLDYGLGMGAMCAKWLRIEPRAGRRLARIIVRRGLVRYTRRFWNSRTRHAQTAYLRGLSRGHAEARRLPLAGMMFIDPEPPAPVTLAASGSDPLSTEVIA